MFLRIFFLYSLSACTLAFTDEYALYANDAGFFFDVGDCLILGVVAQEGGTPGEDTKHDNGAVDSGLAQINKNGEWMRHFSKRYGISHKQIRDNPYLSILLVGYIIRTELDRSDDIFDAISAYHRGHGRRKTLEGITYASRVFNFSNRFKEQGICDRVI